MDHGYSKAGLWTQGSISRHQWISPILKCQRRWRLGCICKVNHFQLLRLSVSGAWGQRHGILKLSGGCDLASNKWGSSIRVEISGLRSKSIYSAPHWITRHYEKKEVFMQSNPIIGWKLRSSEAPNQTYLMQILRMQHGCLVSCVVSYIAWFPPRSPLWWIFRHSLVIWGETYCLQSWCFALWYQFESEDVMAGSVQKICNRYAMINYLRWTTRVEIPIPFFPN